jgi:hypothetical protein
MAFLTGFSKGASSALGGGRFTLVNVLPGTLLATFIIALYRSHAFDLDHAVRLGDIPPAKDEAAGAVAFALFGLFLVGLLLRPFQVALVQVLEGYDWDRLAFLRALAVERHRRAKTTALIQQEAPVPTIEPSPSLADAALRARRARRADQLRSRSESTLDRYPKDNSSLMPTLLGNVLRRGEEDAGKPYGLHDSMAVYPRMYPSVSPILRADISRNLDLIDTTAALSVTFFVATVVSLPLALRPDLWRLTPAVVLLLTLVSYRGAVRAAAGHALLLATAFDLHRFDMLRGLHLKLPANAADEFVLNERLTEFLHYRDGPALKDAELGRHHPFAHPEAPQGMDQGASPGPDKDQGTAES